MSKTFEEMVLEAHTEQMNGDITPEEYVKRIRQIFDDTVSFYQLQLHRESNDNWVKHAEMMEKIQTKQLVALEKIVRAVTTGKEKK